VSGQRFPRGAHGSGAEHCPGLMACHCLGIHVTYVYKEHKIKTIRLLIIIADNNSDNDSDNSS